MIDKVLLFLKDQLDEALNAGFGPPESGEDRVTLPDGERMDPMLFKLGAVTLLLINIEEEPLLRAADLYRGVSRDGLAVSTRPAVRLHFYVLCVSHFKQYEQGLLFLSLILQYFQHHRVLNRLNAPDLPEGVDKLILELITLPFAEQNEIWNALRTTYHLSVLYKVSLFVFQDEEPAALPVVREMRNELGSGGDR